MPTVDTTYIIGVLREWEKGFLEDDEYIRLIEASTIDEAVHTLADTPYGQWLNESKGAGGALSALDGYLRHVHEWLADKLADERVIQFISARYDALNIASALMNKVNKDKEIGELSGLGFIDHDVLYSCLWHELGWDRMPEFWERTLREITAEEMEPVSMLAQVAKSELSWKKSLAFTPLMRALVAWQQEKTREAAKTRPMNQGEEAKSFERSWDERLLSVCRQFNKEPMGYDPIIAFWYGKESEVKNLRVLLTAKFAGIETNEIHSLRGSLYRSLG